MATRLGQLVLVLLALLSPLSSFTPTSNSPATTSLSLTPPSSIPKIPPPPQKPPSSKWRVSHGNLILPPPGRPRALIHFLPGQFLSPTPILYSPFLENLSQKGYLIISTPYNPSLDRLKICDEILTSFKLIAPEIIDEFGVLPVIGMGHSNGAVLSLLISSLFPDAPRFGNILISFNDKGLEESIPFYDIVRPGLQSISSLGLPKILSDFSENLINTNTPVDTVLKNVSEATGGGRIGEFIVKDVGRLINQLPSLITELGDVENSQTPTREEVELSTIRGYRTRRSLIVGFKSDGIDEGEVVSEWIGKAGEVRGFKEENKVVEVERWEGEGGHSEVLGGSEEVVEKIEEWMVEGGL
ncbi:hypothetical protein TrLO_g9038 [Triparma laevis f. longispina]|uniref:Uncharacterized protein n=1 Tax=Triparma laevis f. longispina TaxID=1714387 RepID=A0A9W7FEU1_9STRA|nr:hypothetical protein TrLO_g9038 [Triparma laevis f. longispina]